MNDIGANISKDRRKLLIMKIKNMLELNPDILLHIENVTNGVIFNEVWDCDIKESLKDLIIAHNNFREKVGLPLEKKFLDLTGKKMTLTELLMKDLDQLNFEGSPINQLIDKITVIESYGPDPNAMAFPIEAEKGYRWVIVFKTPLIYFVHSFFSKLSMLSSYKRHCSCLPEHDSILLSDEYSDQNLIANLFKDIEVFFDRKQIQHKITPIHLGEPYNFCEKVEGARKFILMHEISHIALFGINGIEETIDSFGNGLKNIYDLKEKISVSWALEIMCDTYALNYIINVRDPANVQGEELYAVENFIIGILLFFLGLEIVEISTDEFYDNEDFKMKRYSDYVTSHPPASLRKDLMIQCLKESDLYNKNSQIKKTVDQLIRDIEALIGIIGRASTLMPPLKSFNIANRLDRQSLTYSHRFFNYSITKMAINANINKKPK